MDKRQSVEGVVRALRRVNFQGSIFGQTIAIRLGLSESDIDALELLIDTGRGHGRQAVRGHGPDHRARSPGVIDRLEQAGYVRRVTDPADRRRVVVEVVPERVATIESLLDSLERAAAAEVDRYSPEQLATINDFLVADGRPHPVRVRPPSDADRGRRLGADRPGRALGAARRPSACAPAVPLRGAGTAAAGGPLGRGALPGPLRRRDPAGPRPRRPCARPVPRASRSTGASASRRSG